MDLDQISKRRARRRTYREWALRSSKAGKFPKGDYMDYDSSVLYDRKRRIAARKARLRDHETAFQTAQRYWAFRDIDTLMSQGPDSRRGEPTLSPANAVNATGKVRREWKGMRGHSYKARRSQIVKNSQGKNVVVMTRADRDKAMQAKFGSIHTD